MEEVANAPGDGERQAKAPLIIGVGASAVAVDSIERFFGKLALGNDQALVLVLQYREAVADERLRPLAPSAPERHPRIDDWSELAAAIEAAIHDQGLGRG